jgi:hypothetical protein
MPCHCANIDTWTAILNKQPIGKPTLSVKGKAQCNTGPTHVRLEEQQPPGFNPRDLLLVLAWTDPTDSKAKDIRHHKVSFTKQPSPDYDTVTITNCPGARINVEIVT